MFNISRIEEAMYFLCRLSNTARYYTEHSTGRRFDADQITLSLSYLKFFGFVDGRLAEPSQVGQPRRHVLQAQVLQLDRRGPEALRKRIMPLMSDSWTTKNLK